jgi:hypothetical protein
LGTLETRIVPLKSGALVAKALAPSSHDYLNNSEFTRLYFANNYSASIFHPIVALWMFHKVFEIGTNLIYSVEHNINQLI